jgi:2-polyprenyl-3-methyl-5-hydroxy-6-metoxy-1,4-benzoquinol methylase
MFRQVVKDYSIVAPLAGTGQFPRGESASPKDVVFHILEDNSQPVEILDIGFGTGTLGEIVKNNPATAHWAVDGVDGFEPNCCNAELFDKMIYRHIWYGLAQEIPLDQFKKYKIICLLDIVEHLTADTARWLVRTLLASMADDAFLFISTPLWFYPQEHIQEGDLEEHLIGVPATSMMALLPLMYTVVPPLVGGFVFAKRSLDFIEFFQPTSDRSFSYERGLAIAEIINCQYVPGQLFKLA